MFGRLPSRSLACWMLAFAVAIPSAVAQPKHDKSVWNYDGGIFLETDGSFPGGACFRVKGRADAPEFFVNLKREDTTSGTLFRRGNDVVTNFPKRLQLVVAIFDFPCDHRLSAAGTRVYLTDDMIRTLRFSFFWKRGLEMRPVTGITIENFEVRSFPRVAIGMEELPPPRQEWILSLAVPSEGVPLTDSLVLTMRTPDHHIVARTAARL